MIKSILMSVAAAVTLTACGAANGTEATGATLPPAFTGQLPALSGDHVWTIDPAASKLSFEADYNGFFTAGFTRFGAAIKLDPSAPENGEIYAVVDTASFRADNRDVMNNLPMAAWLDTKTHSAATFNSKDITKSGENRYAAKGDLTLKGITKPAVLTFDLNINDDRAVAEGILTVNRMDYNVGTGSDFKDESWVKFPVKIIVRIEARR